MSLYLIRQKIAFWAPSFQKFFNFFYCLIHRLPYSAIFALFNLCNFSKWLAILGKQLESPQLCWCQPCECRRGLQQFLDLLTDVLFVQRLWRQLRSIGRSGLQAKLFHMAFIALLLLEILQLEFPCQNRKQSEVQADYAPGVWGFRVNVLDMYNRRFWLLFLGLCFFIKIL